MTAWEGLTPPYRTIVADPPWPYPGDAYATQSRTAGQWTGKRTRRPLPYSQLSVNAIAALSVRDLAATDARLFLWTTNRHLPSAFTVLDAWQCRYVQTLVWHKRDGNMGGGVAPRSVEFLLVARWGAPAIIGRAPSALVSTAAPKVHSRKPSAMLDLIEAVSPGPYVELFARSPRLGWDSWGYGWEERAS